MQNEWTTYIDGDTEVASYKSIDDAKPEDWDKVNKSKTFTGKLFHPNDNHNPVTQPDHYNKGAIEAIEAIKASMHPQEYKGYLKGNCLKYLWRYEYKNGVEDLRKARVYLDWLIKEVAL